MWLILLYYLDQIGTVEWMFVAQFLEHVLPLIGNATDFGKNEISVVLLKLQFNFHRSSDCCNPLVR